MTDTLGFIMLRCVNTKDVDRYWKYNYESIRYFYPDNYIIIIDDNSDYDLIDLDYENQLYNTKIIKSEFPKRGEILPNKLFDTAVILHDSAFINSKIDFNVKKAKYLWNFLSHHWDDVEIETTLIKSLDNHSDVLDFYYKPELWNGCFGAMSVIKHDYLMFLNDKYNISNMLPFVNNKKDRSCIERVIACMLRVNNFEEEPDSFFGTIHDYCPWGITMDEIEMYQDLPIIKVWSGR